MHKPLSQHSEDILVNSLVWQSSQLFCSAEAKGQEVVLNVIAKQQPQLLEDPTLQYSIL